MTDRLYDLAALDMDGTLLNSAHEITPFTRDALNRADAAGKVIALCTGRCLSELRGPPGPGSGDTLCHQRERRLPV